MGKKLSATQCARRERGRFPFAVRCTLLGLLLALMVSGCADPGDASDKDRGGFYGGVSGGYSIKR